MPLLYLHTEILKNTELNNFYRIYPEKFNNKTNGITFRRWLLHCDPEMTEFITSLIGPGFKKNAEELEKLGAYVNDEEVLKKLLAVKGTRKTELKNYLAKTQGIELDDNSIYDIQIKRLHEYKRHQMNALYVIHKYFEIKAGKKPARPITVIFGAKAAPGYYFAKQMIRFIVELGEVINNDPRVNDKMKVVYLEDYRVTLAELMIPAADISEQISLAGTEASGTGNMKFMINGAITLGTLDGANVEIHETVGDENMLLFGMTTPEAQSLSKNGYQSKLFYDNNPVIKHAIEEMRSGLNGFEFHDIANNLINVDPYMVLADFDSYSKVHQKAEKLYADQQKWQQMALVNIAGAGRFAADRAIHEYAQNIWGATPVPAGEQKTAGKTTVTTEESVKKTTVKSTTAKRTTKSTKKGTNS